MYHRSLRGSQLGRATTGDRDREEGFGVCLEKPNNQKEMDVFPSSHFLSEGSQLLGSVLLPATVSKQSSRFLNKAFTNQHHPLLLVIG